MTAVSLRGLVLPAVLVLFASGGNPLDRYELLSLLVVGPALVSALLKQGVYNYRFTDEELVIREGILFKKERHIPYDRVHNVATIRNPVHRLLGVASARVETASGGEPEAVMRVLTLGAIDELRRYALGKERVAASAKAQPASDDKPGVLLRVPVGELVRLGLISNRGFLVVAAVIGVLSQTNWWDRDWDPLYEAARQRAPQWSLRLLEPGTASLLALAVLGGLVLFVVLLRLFSVGWYLVKYYEFELRWEDDDLRTEYGLMTRVSSLIPVRRIQLVSISASLLHRWAGRAGVDLETAGAIEADGSGDLDGQLGAVGLRSSRQWLAPIIPPDRAVDLVREVMPDIDLDAVSWRPISERASARILRRSILLLALSTAVLTALLELTPIPVSGWHSLWLPVVLGPLAYFAVVGWVRNAGYALTGEAVLYRSGWLRRDLSVVRFDKMQTVKLAESPFDRRHRMAKVSVDTAGAGGEGHRIAIPYLDAAVAHEIFARLYAETRATEFSW